MQRIAWIDVYKAICIILMVIGHATGLFNHYIYQFHMAAFFFISGYTSKIWKKDLESVVIQKSKTLLLPWFTMLIAIGIVRAAKAIILSEITFGQGLKNIVICVKDALILGNADYMLGAGWFLWALFFVFVIQRLIWRATEKRHIAVYGIATVLVYVLGYFLQKHGYRQPHCFDMALIGQLFFGVGVILSKCNVLERLRKQKWCYAVYVAAALLMFMMKWLGGKIEGGVAVDYPSRMYPNVWLTALAPIGGILLIFGLSELIGRINNARVIWPFSKIGSSTLGVVFFHFIGFKIATLLLIPFKITSLQDTQAFLLPASAQAYAWGWFFYSVVSLLFCIVAWSVLMKIPYVNCLLGKTYKPNKATIQDEAKEENEKA